MIKSSPSKTLGKNDPQETYLLTALECVELEKRIFTPNFMRLAFIEKDDFCSCYERRVWMSLRKARTLFEATMIAQEAYRTSRAKEADAAWSPSIKASKRSIARREELDLIAKSMELRKKGRNLYWDRRERNWVDPDKWNPVPYIDPV